MKYFIMRDRSCFTLSTFNCCIKTIFAKVFITVRQQTTQDQSKRWLLCFTLSLPFLYDSVGIGHIYAAGCLVVLLLFKKIYTFSIQLFLLIAWLYKRSRKPDLKEIGKLWHQGRQI